MGSPTLKGTETLFTSRTCHETHNYVVCTCNTLQPFSPNDSKLISVESLHDHSNAIQVSHTQWCVISEMNSFTYGGLTCPADHSFCLEVTEDLSMGQIDILRRMPKDAEVSPWRDDTQKTKGPAGESTKLSLAYVTAMSRTRHTGGSTPCADDLNTFPPSPHVLEFTENSCNVMWTKK